MRDHPVIEQIMLTGYPLEYQEEQYECEFCGTELADENCYCEDCELDHEEEFI